MAAKQPIKRKSKRHRPVQANNVDLERAGNTVVVMNGGDDHDYVGPMYVNPETPEEREKRLAARKALTLRAFQKTYENRRRPHKSS